MSGNLKIVGRLTRERYMHGDNLVERVRFKVLKRKSNGSLSDIIQDPDYDISKIDFNKFDSGVYELTATNISRDIESGIIDAGMLLGHLS